MTTKRLYQLLDVTLCGCVYLNRGSALRELKSVSDADLKLHFREQDPKLRLTHSAKRAFIRYEASRRGLSLQSA